MNALNEVDVLIVGRGGGSLEELWAFNEEIVARSIHASTIPVISAVGHETDFTIADFVADLRAATPTAAAELAVPHQAELRSLFSQLERRIRNGLNQQVRQKRDRLNRLMRSPYFTYPRQHLLQPAERLDRLKDMLIYRMQQHLGAQKEALMKREHKLMSDSPKERLRHASEKLERTEKQLQHLISLILQSRRQSFIALTKQLDALSPLKVMQRGYSLVYTEQEKSLVKSVTRVQPGDLVKIRLSDGQLDCQVWSITEEKGGESWENRK